jgi:small subunit ribosomal protein S5
MEKKDNKNQESVGSFAPKKRGGFRARRPESEQKYDSRVLNINRVTRVTSGGRRMRFQAVVAIGDRKGKVGIGVAKGSSVRQAIEKASKSAEKTMITVPLKDGLIAYPVYGKAGASKVMLKDKPKGGGLVAGSAIRVLCELAGITDVSAKVLSRSSNKLNIAQATINALQQLS